MTPRVAVIGGGWAGCTAALTLAEAGVPITLFEASRTLGGRARVLERDGLSLDNGQHILLGAYEHTLQLIERLRPATEPAGLWRLPLSIEQPPEFRLTCPRLPAPLHLLAGLATARGLGWHDKVAAARWAQDALRTPDETDRMTVSEYTRNQPEKLNRLLWHPLCISALNTPPHLASARVFREVVRAAFNGRRHHSDLLLPQRDLTALLPAPAAARVVQLGGEVKAACRVSRLGVEAQAVTIDTPDGSFGFSHAVLAVAPQHLARLIQPIAGLEPIARQLASYAYQPIATGYFQYDAGVRLDRPLFALADGPAQFVFDRGQSHGQDGLLACVASAASALSPDWLDQSERQLQRVIPGGSLRWRKSIIEKQATYACLPDMPRPPVRTAQPRLFLAGDYTSGPYPATLESATLSGVQSANALLEQL